MKVRELREILDQIDGELEVLVCDQYTDTYQIEKADIIPCYRNQTTNNDIPFCIRIDNR